MNKICQLPLLGEPKHFLVFCTLEVEPAALRTSRTGCDPIDVGGVLGPKAKKKRFVKQLMLTLDLDTSPGVVQFSVIKLNMDTFDADAFVAAKGKAPPSAIPTTEPSTSVSPRNSSSV